MISPVAMTPCPGYSHRHRYYILHRHYILAGQ